MARPSDYTDELGERICFRLSQGESIVTICSTEDMPAQSTIYRWLRDERREKFREMYARAREDQADWMFERMREVASTPMEGEIVTIKDNGKKEVRREDMLGHRRLLVDTLKWQAAKLKPRVHCDKIDVTSDDKPLASASAGEVAVRVAAILNGARERRDAATSGEE